MVLLPEPSTTVLARLMSMVRIIDAHPGISVEELARHFGRPEKSVRTDIALLDRAGVGDLLPGRTFDIDYDLFLEEDLLSLRTPLNLSAPLPITDREFARLVTALKAMAPTLTEADQKLLPQTLSTLLAARVGTTTDALSVATLTGPAPAISDLTREKIAVIQEAMASASAISFDYVNGAGHTSERTVSPRELILERDGWVVTGFCHTAGSERTFRLDRSTNLASAIQAPIPSNQVPSTTPSTEPEDPGEEVTVTLRADAAWALRESPAATVEEGPDGTLIATYRVWDPIWIRTELLSLSPYVEAVSPRHHFDDAANYARVALEETMNREDASHG